MALGMLVAALVWLFTVWPPPVWWRDHWPRATALMREAEGWNAGRLERSNVPSFQPTALKDISPALQRMVIMGEDSRFRTHYGIDPTEIVDALGASGTHGFWSAVAAAWHRRDRWRGASTITQQLAKNLYLSTSRNPLRKVKEAATAMGLELALPKDRILELYLSGAEWGPGIWGVDAASRAYFGVPPSRLTAEQAAELVATLPHPRTSNPTFRPERTLARRDLILARYRGVAVNIPPEEETDSLPLPAANLPPVDSVRLPALGDSGKDSLHPRPADATGAQRRTADSSRDSIP